MKQKPNQTKKSDAEKQKSAKSKVNDMQAKTTQQQTNGKQKKTEQQKYTQGSNTRLFNAHTHTLIYFNASELCIDIKICGVQNRRISIKSTVATKWHEFLKDPTIYHRISIGNTKKKTKANECYDECVYISESCNS